MDDKDKASEKGKKGSSKLILIVVVVLALGAFGGGVFIGPKVLASVHPAKAHGEEGGDKEKEKEKDDEPPHGTVVVLDALVVDLRDASGDMHHLKVGVAIELKVEYHGDEFKRLEPRARDAAIGYLRTLTFEDATNPAKYETVKTAIGEKITKAVGKSLVRKVLFTEYVAQ